MFLVVNLSFAFVELVWGIWTNSLGLITDSFHMFFDCSALVAGLIASLISKWPANETYRYGYGRAQVIGGFVNGLFLIFVALFIVTEATERFFEPPEVQTEMLLEVSVMGLLVNILGIFAFQHAHTHGGEACHGHGDSGGAAGGHGHDCSAHGHSHASPAPAPTHHGHSHDSGHSHDCGHGHHDHGHSHHGDAHTSGHGHAHGANGSCSGGNHGNSHGHDSHSNHQHSDTGRPKQNNNSIKGEGRSLVLDGVLLHVIADTLGSVSVIISSILIHQYGWMIADPIGSLFTSALILISVVPLLRNSVQILMQRTPTKLEPFLLGSFQKITAINGVVEYRDARFWTLTGNDWHGSMILRIRPDSDGYAIRAAASSILEEVGVNKMIIQVDKF